MKKLLQIAQSIVLTTTLLLSNNIQAQTWEEVAKSLPTPYAQNLNNQYYGRAVSVDGNYAVVGSLYSNNRGRAYIYYYDGTNWVLEATLTASDENQGYFFGWSVSISGDNIAIGCIRNPDQGISAGAVYVFTKPASGWVDMTETAKIYASDASPSDEFGFSVSISGDNIVVGSESANNGYGKAYLFTKPSGGWTSITETAKLSRSSTSQGGGFGCSVSISGDNIVIGEKLDDANGNWSGSAYVFTKPGSVWTDVTAVAKLTPTDGAASDEFGFSVAISGDNIVVGAYRDDDSGNNSGSVYVFTKPGSGWTDMNETGKLLPSTAATNDQFGFSVAISGENVLVGAIGNNVSGSQSGSGYAYTKPTVGWGNMTETAQLISSDNSGAQMGFSGGISGDNIILGATNDWINGNNAGAIYFFKKSGVNWSNSTELVKFTSPQFYGNQQDYYGRAVAIDGDYAVIGVPLFQEETGMAYVLFYDGTNWITQAQLLASDGAFYQLFGHTVSISGDNIVIGALNDDDNGSNSGLAYIFTKPVNGWSDMTETAKILPSDGGSGDRFGNSVSISGDNLVIGAREFNSRGAAYVFTKPTTGWTDTTETAKLLPLTSVFAAYFGISVSISGDNILIGENRGQNGSGIMTGSAYVFEKPNGGWVDTTETAKLLASDGNVGVAFGSAVSISGDNLVIGAYLDNENGTNAGAAYVFVKPVNGWVDTTETAKLLQDNQLPNYEFAKSVAISGDNIVISSYKELNANNSRGKAYVFVKPINGWIDTTETTQIFPISNDDYYRFGYAVAISGSSIVVGPESSQENGSNSGSAYLFKPCTTTGTDAQIACDSYTWIDGNTYTSNNNTATFTLTSSAGCDSLVTLDLTINSVDTTATQAGATLTASASSATYQWLDCNNNFSQINGETAQTFTATSNGSYAVEVIENGCTDTSYCYTVISTNITENDFDDELIIYPNPTNGNFAIDMGKNYSTISITITDLTGRIIYQKSYTNTQQIQISIIEPTGIYILSIETENKKAVIRLIKE